MAFEIQDDVPMPRRSTGRKGSKYPFADMEVGQSFLVEGDIKAATVRSAIGAFVKRFPEAGKFALRNTDEGLRVWRTE